MYLDRDLLLARARGLSPGFALADYHCPDCGRSGSFSLFATDDGFGYKCHRAACGAAMFKPWTVPPIQGSAAAPAFKPYPFPTRAPGTDSLMWGLLDAAPAERTSRNAARLGFSARSDVSQEIVWLCRDLQFSARCMVSRDYRDKRIRTYRTADGPLYGYWSLEASDRLWIVEDPVSAAKLAWRGGVDTISLLGTNFPQALRGELADHVARKRGNLKIVVALDPDAADKSIAIREGLTIALPCDILFAPLTSDPKDMGPGELAQLTKYYG